MDRFEEIQNFVRVVETGSISRAADRSGMAKSAVSRRLSDLEQRLGVQLIKRTTRQMKLTDSGRSYYERAIRILADLEESEQAVRQEHGNLSGVLRVAAPLTFGLLHLGPAITEFQCGHPDLQFDLDFNDRRIDILQEGFDVGIRIGALEDSSLIARRLVPVRSVICASPEYLKKNGVPQSPEDLQRHACLVYSNLPDPQTWSYHDREDVKHSIKVRIGMQANNGDFLREAAVAGLGIVHQPTFIAYPSIASGQLIPILTGYTWPTVNAYAVYPQTRHLSQRVRSFVDFLVQKFQGIPYWDNVINRHSPV
jgi:DNA-binding transcriptional LysR family regulator